MRVLLSPLETRVSPVHATPRLFAGAPLLFVLARPVVRDPVRVAPSKVVLPVRLMLPGAFVEGMGLCEI
jgi:hypothetical protein